MRRARWAAVTAAAVLSLLVAGCTATPEAPTTEGTTAPAPAPVAVTPGPPPPPGATGAPVVGVITLPPVPVGQPAAFGGGLVARVLSVADVELEARGPGEIGGPGAEVTVEFSNEAGEAVDLAGVVVNASYADGVPAGSSGLPPEAGPLAPGETRQVVQRFQVPGGDAASLLIEIGFSGSPNVVLVHR